MTTNESIERSVTSADEEEVGLPPQASIMTMASGFVLAKAIIVAAELGISDKLSHGPLSAHELAAEISVHGDSLYRLLRMLASHGIFKEDESGRFHLTPLAAVLQEDMPGSVRDLILMLDDSWWKACGYLKYAVTTGNPAFDHAFGTGFFDYMEKNEEAGKRFNTGMSAASGPEGLAVVSSHDFSQYSRIIDVGGGQGSLIIEILKTSPSLTGILFDLPSVIERFDLLVTSEVADRCETVGGDFFESVPAGGDAYVLKKILHDWDDEQSISILRNCRKGMNENSRVLTVDTVIPRGNQPHHGKNMDVLMMILLAGRERTEEEFSQLYEAAGLRLTRVIPTPSAFSIIEGECAT